jgi:hypothetical protein
MFVAPFGSAQATVSEDDHLVRHAGAFLRSVTSVIIAQSTNREMYAKTQTSTPRLGTPLKGYSRRATQRSSTGSSMSQDGTDFPSKPGASVVMCRFTNGVVGPVKVSRTYSSAENSEIRFYISCLYLIGFRSTVFVWSSIIHCLAKLQQR